jgi:3-oxoacyl-[acyl-carrier protein] reductase
MSQKFAVITGGSRGIGFAAAKLLGEQGWLVGVIGKTAETTDAAVGQLVALDIDAVGFAADVADANQMKVAMEFFEGVAPIDVLINSAGVMSDKAARTIRTTPEEWHRVMSINLDGTFNAIAAALPAMVKRQSGRVINVSACLGRMSGPGTAGGLAPYRISKAGVNALTKNLAAEVGQGTKGVFVDAMCPNHTRTDMGGPDAPRSAEEGAETIIWLATRETTDAENNVVPNGLLWEERQVVPW